MALIRQRKLSKQQMRRIEKQTLQVNEDELLEGVVIAHYGKQLEVQVTKLPNVIPTAPPVDTNAPEPFWQPLALHDIWRCHTRTNLSMLAAGDKVTWVADCNTGLGRIESVHDRYSLITRPDRYHKVKPVAANIDLLAIVFAALPLPAHTLIDRYLLISHHFNIKPLLILNKSDLLSEPEHQKTLTLLDEYRQLGYDSIVTETITDDDASAESIQELKQILQGKTVVFAGQSGVGKSSLINKLLPNSNQTVNIISENSLLGQHTTTTSRLLPFNQHDLSEGGIIDTPGIREYGIWHLEPEDIISGFVELTDLAANCKFRDCQHLENIKGCALRQAITDKTVLKRRVDNMVLLQQEANTKDY